MKAKIYFGQDKEDGFIGIIDLKDKYWNEWCKSGKSILFDVAETEEIYSISIHHLNSYIQFIDNCTSNLKTN